MACADLAHVAKGNTTLQTPEDGAPAEETTILFPRIVGLGSASFDLLAYVDGFPAPDSKIRTTRFVRAGGGNCANTLVQLARLGADTDIITKVGEGAVGEETVASIAHEGVGMRWLVRDESSSASFTYVIVDTKTDTRTCIHTPSSELDPSEVSAAMLQPPPSSHGPRPAILHLCTRHTLAAVRLAQIAVEEGVPVSVDMEKDRPGLSKLLPLVTYVITNAHFPTALTGVPLSSGDADGGVEDGGDPTAAVAAMCVHHCIRARVAVCTLGKRGSLALVRHDARVTSDGDNTGAQSSISTPMVDLVATQLPSSSDSAVEVSLVTVDGVSFTRLRCPAAPVVGSIVDTTGAGDVFIGGFLFAIASGWTIVDALVLGSRCAANKLTKEGARCGPSFDELAETFPGYAPYSKRVGSSKLGSK